MSKINYLFERNKAGAWKSVTHNKPRNPKCEYWQASANCELDALKKVQASRKKRKPQKSGVPPRGVGSHTFGDTLFIIEGDRVWAENKEHAIEKHRRLKDAWDKVAVQRG